VDHPADGAGRAGHAARLRLWHPRPRLRRQRRAHGRHGRQRGAHGAGALGAAHRRARRLRHPRRLPTQPAARRDQLPGPLDQQPFQPRLPLLPGLTRMQSPPIDPRGYEEIVAETRALAERHSGWRPDPDGRPDAGSALIGVFGRFAELVIERLNRAPEKSYLAFLHLIGTAQLPPQPPRGGKKSALPLLTRTGPAPPPPPPARVPLTFQLAENSPVDAAVPAGTQ